MRRPLRRPVTRSALEAAAIPTYAGPRPVAERAEALHFIQAPGRLPRGRRVYAIGDVHGRLARLQSLHRLIAEDLAARPVPQAVLVHLGDYIDQGPDSAGVLTHLQCFDSNRKTLSWPGVTGPSPSAGGAPRETVPHWPGMAQSRRAMTERDNSSPAQTAPTKLDLPGVTVVNLMGDHERMLLDAIDGERAAATDWLWAGGREALSSWGLPADLPREAWAGTFPADHIAFLRSLVLTHQEGDYLFVHAGLRPGVTLRDQARDDLLMIRQPFLASEADFGAIVVHGHSSQPTAAILPNRIGLDTGAGICGRLTCAVLEEDGIALMAG